ncbi:MAG TPA: hypothetical protein VF574_04870 [Allosphingosinicella sp.]|jgi:hypothetical protein
MADVTAQVHAIVVADEIRQEANGKWLIVGYYTDVKLEKAPGRKPLFIHSVVSGISPGEHDIEILILNIAGKKKMLVPSDRFTCPSPDHVLLFVSELEDFQFPNPGDYQVQVMIDGKKCGDTVFSVAFPWNADAASENTPQAAD